MNSWGVGVRVAGTLTATAALGLAAGMAEAQAFLLRRYTVPILPAGAEPLRLLHLSDLHLLACQRRKQRFVSSLADLEPDLVVSTGDNFGQRRALQSLLDAYAPLLRFPGLFVVSSNDFLAPVLVNPLGYLTGPTTQRLQGVHLPWRELADAFTSAGWHNLVDAHATLRIKGLTIDARGTGDAHIDADRYQQVAGPVPADVQLSLGVTHAPYRRVLDAMTDDRVGLILAGHTHGGQVCLPGHGALTTNCDLPTSLAKGLHRYEHQGKQSWLHVSAGLGTSPFAPYRLFCRPEASLLTLVAAQ